MNAGSVIPPHRCASFWKRFYAYGYDSLIVIVASSLIGWQANSVIDTHALPDVDSLQPAIAPTGMDASTQLLPMLGSVISWSDIALPMILSAIYNIAFVAGSWQATPGKRFCNIYVLNADGSRLNVVQSALRHAASGLSMLACGVGYLTIFFTRDNIAPHDMLCRTRVVTGKVSD